MSFFRSKRPVAEIIGGAVFIISGFVLVPLIHPPGQRIGFDPLLQWVPGPWLIVVLSLIGLVLIVQGIGSHLLKRRQSR